MGVNFNLDGTVDAWAEHKKKQAEAEKKAAAEQKKKEEESYDESVWNIPKQRTAPKIHIPQPTESQRPQSTQPVQSATQKPVSQQMNSSGPSLRPSQSQQVQNKSSQAIQRNAAQIAKPIESDVKSGVSPKPSVIAPSVPKVPVTEPVEDDDIPDPTPEDIEDSFADKHLLDKDVHKNAQALKKTASDNAKSESDSIADELIADAQKKNSVKSALNDAYNEHHKKLEKSDYCVIKKFPKEIMQMMQKEFPGATQIDALLAWVLTHCDENFAMNAGSVITDSQLELVNKHENDSMHSTYELCASMLKAQQKLDYKLSTLQMSMSYMLYDRLGFREGIPSSPGDVDFMEHGVTDLSIKADEQTKSFRAEINNRTGRRFK